MKCIVIFIFILFFCGRCTQIVLLFLGEGEFIHGCFVKYPMYLKVHQGIPLRALVSRKVFYSKNHYCYYLDPTRFISSGRLDAD